MNVIDFDNVWKKFKRGEKNNSLRDAIPYYFKMIAPWKTVKAADSLSLESSEFWSLSGVSFSVKENDILGIIGPNGAGKSTILKLLSKIMQPNRGTIRIEGRLSALIEVTAGFHPDLTGRENIYLNGTILGMSKKEIDTKFDEIVEFSGLKEFINTPVKRYSSGMFSRLGFSVAAHMDPDILLVDEVLSVGDIAFQGKCIRKMKELLGSGATIVLVSHDLALVQNLCKRVILLDGGTIMKEGPAEEIIPFYQNIVYKKSEDDLRREIETSRHKVMVNDSSAMRITDIAINGEKKKERFKVNEALTITVSYEAFEKIPAPVFMLEILRSDGILCCASSSAADGFPIESVEGRGTVNIIMGDLGLAPSVYLLKISVWDKDQLHPYDVRKNNILRFEHAEQKKNMQNGIFIKKFTWEYRPPPSLYKATAAGEVN
jgi:ABC-type polysaccharide/polyol phosphate transport system ATPase subunit